MRVWVVTDHNTHWPVGGASIVVATDEIQARSLLDSALIDDSLKPDDYTLREIMLDTPYAEVLCDGDY